MLNGRDMPSDVDIFELFEDQGPAAAFPEEEEATSFEESVMQPFDPTKIRIETKIPQCRPITLNMACLQAPRRTCCVVLDTLIDAAPDGLLFRNAGRDTTLPIAQGCAHEIVAGKV